MGPVAGTYTLPSGPGASLAKQMAQEMTANSIHQVAVLGLGTMGHGIVQAFAAAGYPVRGWDEQPAACQSLVERIRRNLDDFVEARLLKRSEVEPILARIQVARSEREAVDGVQFVTEAVREDLGVKQELLARLESLLADDTILASNSSTFPSSQSAARMRRPERSLVTHWFNPPHIVPAVEVVPGPRTSPDVTQAALDLLKRIGKEAIHLRQELPGFVVNRVQVAVMREVWDLVDRGVATPEQIDALIRGSMGFRLAAIGPLEVHDFGGLDVCAAVYRNLATEIRSDTQVPDAVRRLVEAGHYGPKSGRGFYAYGPETADRKRSARDARFLALVKLWYSRPPAAPAPAE